MIISPGRRYIFVHIPKTGGTSLALALEERAMKDDILIGDTPKAQRRRKRTQALPTRGRLWKHSRLSDLQGYLGPEELKGFFVFTLVRNPWDRLVSYYHWLRVQSFDHPAVALAGSSGFESFLMHPETVAALRNDTVRAYVSDSSGAERCGVFLRLEHLRADLARVEAHMGFRLDVPHVNASDRPQGYRDCYSDALAEHVGALFAEDIERFGYQF